MSNLKEIVQARYVGFYGRRHTPAFVAGVGNVFYGEVREMTRETYNRIDRQDWELIENVCLMIDHAGKICGKERAEGSHLCAFHIAEIKERGILPNSLRQPK